MSKPRPTVLAYYFPNWHVDPRNEEWFGRGWTEWNLLRSARPRFSGHRQPRVPALGYRDESDPTHAAQDIQMATEHGVDGFLVDYYWYGGRPYLDGALDRGLLGAVNAQDVTFALMWANHDYVNLFPHPDPAREDADLLARGALDRSDFEAMCRHVIGRYFHRPNYFRVKGRPWFTVYELGSLVQGLGGLDETQDALRWFDDECRRSGLPGVHLDVIVWDFAVLPQAHDVDDIGELIVRFGFQSAGSYVWIHHTDMREAAFPMADAHAHTSKVVGEYERWASVLPVPFNPNVTVGWDPSPRADQERDWVQGRYPWTSAWDISPEQFEVNLRRAQAFVAASEVREVVTVNAWNEWTEGSYLLPDTERG
ncbi:MAG: glycoside hydrolase family 99-like domain-containing protein, partial [Angustibacter sp.]